MSKLSVLVVHKDTAELDRLSNLLQKGSHSVLPLETMTDASEALGLQRFDAVLLAENTPADELAHFAATLRGMERDRRADGRTSILTCSRSVTEAKISTNGRQAGHIDAFLPEHFEPAIFARTVDQLSRHLSGPSCASVSDGREEPAIFDGDEFRELLGNSPELLDEIIGLFLEESGSQVQQMQICLQSENFDALAKLAHTLKGSLGTLHAHRARANAQALEVAATRGMTEDCRAGLDRLMTDLDELRPLLIQVRPAL
ncbi:MAG: Hpt domain-containing protein [Bryobacteraceae bacterium]